MATAMITIQMMIPRTTVGGGGGMSRHDHPSTLDQSTPCMMIGLRSTPPRKDSIKLYVQATGAHMSIMNPIIVMMTSSNSVAIERMSSRRRTISGGG
jgi:outer membrane PBP1 activator LpoA protein